MDAKNTEFIQENRALWPRFPVWAYVLAAVAALLVIFIMIFDWNWFKGPLARYASRQTGRVVRIDGNLDVHVFSFHPRATINGLKVSNPDWAPPGDTAQIPKLSVQVSLWPLLRGDFVWEKVIAQSPNISFLRDKQGRATWEFGKTASENAKPLDIPPIRQFLISNGTVHIEDDLRHMVFDGSLAANENADVKGNAFQMVGKGMLNKHAFQMNVSGGPLINVDREKPYPFKMSLTSATTHITADASILHPFNLGQMSANATFSGANLADLYYLTGVVFPRTGPYKLSAAFARDGTTYRLMDMNGTVGNSDLEGDMTVDARTGRPYLTADLRSRRLDFVDLGPLIGGAPSRAKIAQAAAKAGIPAADAQAQVIVPQNQHYLLPDVPLDVDRVNQMDANIHYKALSVQSQDFPLRNFELAMTIDHGLLKANPISFALTQGKVAGSFTIDARKKVPAVTADVRVRDIKLEQFVAKAKDNTSMLSGTVDARAVLNGTGSSIHKAMSTANGDFRLIVPGGTIRQQFAELLGISVDRAFLLSGDDPTNIRCVVADFGAQNGVFSARSLVFDTDVMNVTGNGIVDMRNEHLDMQLKGHPKKLTFFRLRAPISVSGPLNRPNVGIVSGAIPVQAGAAVALGLVATPFAAIIPFIDPGLSKDANCLELEQSTPVKTMKPGKKTHR
ncbi:MAG TPA: AsmA family protein [Rhizomicrobium sp.]|nr:AsmA family protein [Rhizomicrobium sp.]